MTMTRYIADGPLIGNLARREGGQFRLYPADTYPAGTPLTLTGAEVGVWVEAASPYLAKVGQTRWFHRDYLTDTPPASAQTAAPSKLGAAVTMPALAPVSRWAAAVEGKRLDVDGVWGAQCVDLSKAWAFENGAPAGAYGNGVDVARNLSALPGWRFEPGTTAPRPGWIGSWGKPFGVWRERDKDGNLTGRVEFFGHTAVVTGAPSNGRVPVLQQDGFDKNTVATRGSLPLDSVVGWAVPPTDPSVPDVVVRPGDTLSKIADRTGVPVAELARVNRLADPNTILVGHVLKVAA